MRAWRADPRAVLLAGLASANAIALSLTGEVAAVGLVVPIIAIFALVRPASAARGRAFEIAFQIIALLALAWFVLAASQGRVLGGAAALTFPVQAHALLQPRGLLPLRRLQVIGFFQLIALAASTTAIFFGPIVLLHVVLAPLVFTLGSLEDAAGEPRRVAAAPAGLVRACAHAAALTLAGGAILFLVLPRYEAGLMSDLRRRAGRMAGFSESVRLGDITSIQSSNEIVMRVRLRGRPPADLRWRGIALDRFTGREWSSTAAPVTVTTRGGATRVAEPRAGLPRLVQEFTVEPISQVHALFHAARPTAVIPQGFRVVRVDAWGNLQRTGEPARRTRYEVVSETAPLLDPLPDDARQAFLQLPPLDERVAALARDAAGEGTIAERARRLERFLLERYEYGLDVDDTEARDPLTWFLFERRRGHCEYFATAMAILLRTQGIPARVVNGFTAGERSRLFDTYIVRRRDAHSWVEAHLPESGWTTFDPTPPTGVVVTPLGDAVELWRRVELIWDDNVIGFNYTVQIGMLGSIQDAVAAARRWIAPTRSAILAALAAALGLALMVAWIRWVRRRRVAARHRIAFYDQAARILARRGFRRRPEQTPWELAAEFAAVDPAAGPAAIEITRLYYAARWGGADPDSARVAELLRRLAA